MRDLQRLYAASFARALATGLAGALLGIYLAGLGLAAAEVGLVVSAGLLGATAATLFVTLRGDRLGRRRTLLALNALAFLGGLGLLATAHPVALAAAACLGMVNGMGRDRGAALALEQAVLPATVDDHHRTLAFARYNVLQDAGHALGALLAGLPAVLAAAGFGGRLAPMRLTVGLYAVLSLLPALAYLRLSPAVEVPEAPSPLAPETRRVLWRIGALFGVDSLAGGFLTGALLSYFFYERFGVGLASVALLFAAARVANALSHLGAAWLARRIGLVNTMVFTHIPSSLLLVTVGLAPSFEIAAALFLLREGLVEMDVPTRQSYVMAMVRPEERTRASGITHLVRLGGWALGPVAAGALMEGLSLWTPLLVAAAMKIAYDLLLFRAFRHLPPPEERR